MKRLCLDITPADESGGIYTISVGSIRNRLTEHTSLNKPAFVLVSVMAWAAPGNYTLRLVEYATQVTMFDNGDYVRRARCGIRYSKNIQKLYMPTDTGTVVVLSTEPGDPTPAMRCTLDYWDAEPNG